MSAEVEVAEGRGRSLAGVPGQHKVTGSPREAGNAQAGAEHQEQEETGLEAMEYHGVTDGVPSARKLGLSLPRGGTATA